MSNEIIRISNMAKQYEKVDTVMYALNKVGTKILHKTLTNVRKHGKIINCKPHKSRYIKVN